MYISLDVGGAHRKCGRVMLVSVTFIFLKTEPLNYAYENSSIFIGSSETGCQFIFLVFMWRHCGHIGVQNNSEKRLLGLWLYYCAKLERRFVIVLYTNMAVSSREWKSRNASAIKRAENIFAALNSEKNGWQKPSWTWMKSAWENCWSWSFQ